MRYITSLPYGFDNANEFLLYLPGKSLHELPEAFLGWVQINLMAVDIRNTDILESYGLYNVEGKQGFSSLIKEFADNTKVSWKVIKEDSPFLPFMLLSMKKSIMLENIWEYEEMNVPKSILTHFREALSVQVEVRCLITIIQYNIQIKSLS